MATSQKVFFVPSYKSAGSQQLSSFKPKGQLISKGDFGDFNSSKKQTCSAFFRRWDENKPSEKTNAVQYLLLSSLLKEGSIWQCNISLLKNICCFLMKLSKCVISLEVADSSLPS